MAPPRPELIHPDLAPPLVFSEGTPPARAAPPAPAPRVVAVVAVVAHHPDLVLRHLERALVHPAQAGAADQAGAAVVALAAVLVGAIVEEGEVGLVAQVLDEQVRVAPL